MPSIVVVLALIVLKYGALAVLYAGIVITGWATLLAPRRQSRRATRGHVVGHIDHGGVMRCASTGTR